MAFPQNWIRRIKCSSSIFKNCVFYRKRLGEQTKQLPDSWMSIKNFNCSYFQINFSSDILLAFREGHKIFPRFLKKLGENARFSYVKTGCFLCKKVLTHQKTFFLSETMCDLISNKNWFNNSNVSTLKKKSL